MWLWICVSVLLYFKPETHVGSHQASIHQFYHPTVLQESDGAYLKHTLGEGRENTLVQLIRLRKLEYLDLKPMHREMIQNPHIKDLDDLGISFL